MSQKVFQTGRPIVPTPGMKPEALKLGRDASQEPVKMITEIMGGTVPSERALESGVFKQEGGRGEAGKLDIDREFISFITSEVDTAERWQGEISDQNAKSMEYYTAQPFGTEVPGQSSVVSTDVMDTIEDMMPILMRIFMSTGNLGKTEPQNSTDTEEAAQAEDYVNYVFSRQNNAFLYCYDFIKDALMQKLGIGKIWYDSAGTEVVEEYENMTAVELAKYLIDNVSNSVEVIEQEEITTTDQATGAETVTYNVKFRLIVGRQVVLEVIPTEEFIISHGATDEDKAAFIGQATRVSLSDLRRLYPDLDFDDDIADGSGTIADHPELSLELTARGLHDGTWPATDAEEAGSNDASQRKVTAIEGYPFYDYNEDGIAERRHILLVGGKLYINEECDTQPYVTQTPIRIPHKLYGLSEADVTKSDQEVKSILLRNMLDNTYLQNNSRMKIVEGMVNVDDLLSSRAGGVVRCKTLNAAEPLITPPLGPDPFNLLQYFDQMRERRTGTNGQVRGLDADALKTHVTQFDKMQNMTQSLGHVELVARLFAETGIKKTFEKIYEAVVKHENRLQVIKLRGEWIDIDPSDWREKRNFTVEVGLGNGNTEQEAVHLEGLWQKMMFIGQANGDMLDEPEVFNFMQDYAANIGKPDVERYIKNPAKIRPEDRQKPGPTDQEVKLQEIEVDAKLKMKELESKHVNAAEDRKLKVMELMYKAQAAQDHALVEKLNIMLAAEELDFEMKNDRNISAER
jgi:hypothetical protein